MRIITFTPPCWGRLPQQILGNEGKHGAMDTQQNAPIEEGSDEATNDEAIDGVVEQVRADIQLGHTHEDVLTLLHQRFSEANIEISREREEELAEQLRAN